MDRETAKRGREGGREKERDEGTAESTGEPKQHG